MITAVLIDDENDALDCLQWELNAYQSEIQIVKTFNNAKEAVLFLNKNTVDAIFLDVEMPEMSGFEFLEMFPKRNFAVIITTAHQDYALPALKKQCLDFLQKPTDSESVKECIDKIITFKNNQLLHQQFEGKLVRKADKSDTKKIIFSCDGKLVFLNPTDILYCESDGNYTTIFLENGNKMLLSIAIGQVEDKLTGDFFRIHNSFIININKVQEFFKNDNYIVLGQNVKIPVSRQRKSEFLDRF